MYILILTKYTKCRDVEQIPYIIEHTIHTQIMEHKIQLFSEDENKTNIILLMGCVHVLLWR